MDKPGRRGIGMVLVASLTMTACAAQYHTVVASVNISGTGPIAVATHEQRPYIVVLKKPEFVGTMWDQCKGGVPCIVYEQTTSDKRALADAMTQAIAGTLSKAGFRAVPVLVAASASPAEVRQQLAQGGGERAVLLTLHKWESAFGFLPPSIVVERVRGNYGSSLAYDVTLSVLDRSGRVLGERRLAGTDKIPNNEHVAAFRTKLETLLADAEVKKALDF